MKRTITLILLSCLLTTMVSAQEIIQWRGTDRTGIYNEPGLMKSWPAEGPKMLWNFDGLGEGHSSVAIASDKIYLTGTVNSQGCIFVIDMNGKLLNKKVYGEEWKTNYEGPRGTITISEGKLYLISALGELFCFGQANLDLIWKKNLLKDYDASNIEWGLNEAPLIIGNKIIATPGGKKNNIIALDKNTGELIWSTPAEGDPAAYCSPLYIGDIPVPQIVTLTANHIVGIELASGKMLWSHPNTNRYSVHANTPVFSNGMILCSSGYGRGATMLRLENGGRSVKEAWFSTEFDNRIGGMVKVGNYAYGSGDSNRYWFCIDWNTGEIKYKADKLASGNVIANDGMLYCYTERGEILLVKATPEKFDIVSRFQVTLGTAQHWAHPVIYKGILYVRHGDSLIAYKIK